MPRTERRISNTGIYHVMLRGINNQLIFEESEDYSKFLSCLSEAKKLSGFTLYAYCLMGNHILVEMKKRGASIRQIARVSGLSKGIVEGLLSLSKEQDA